MPKPLTKINVEKVAHCKKTYLYFGLGDGGEAAKLTRGHSEPTKEAAATFNNHFQRELPILIKTFTVRRVAESNTPGTELFSLEPQQNFLVKPGTGFGLLNKMKCVGTQNVLIVIIRYSCTCKMI